jgi:dipeptidyl aminopeptidase/acylaminoacyl peptidase
MLPIGLVAQVPQVPLEDFFRNPTGVGFSLSPDGKWLASLQPYESRLNIFVKPTAKPTDAGTRVTSVTERDIAGFFWKGNDLLVYTLDDGGDENFHLFAISRQGGDVRPLTPFPGVRASVVDDLEDDPQHMLISLNQRNPQVFDVYRLNVRTGALTLVGENPGNITGWLTDHAGKLRLAFATDGVNQTMLFRETEQDEFKPSLTTNFRESVAPQFFTFDNKNVYAESNRGRDNSAAVMLDPRTGEELEMLFQPKRYDLGGLSYSRKRKVLTAAYFTGAKRTMHFFDKQSEDRYQWLEGQLPGYEVVVTSMDKAEEIFVVRTYSDRSMGSYYLYDSKQQKLQKLQDVSPWINEAQMAAMEPIRFTARDGLEIEGYLTLPLGVPAENLPLIVHPHGGPWARDNWGFNPTVQFLANRGYAVLQINFRGSTGYGRAFWEASFKQWGLTMQDDITDGVQWLVERGVVDAKRIGIYGASYGGYATLAGMAFTPELYACGVDYVGVSNLFSFMNTIPPYWAPFLTMMHEMVGHPEHDAEQFRATSPVFHADKIRAPLFVAQGAKDPRVNIDESDQIVAAVRQSGYEVEYMVKDNEGHGFRNEENRFEFYRAMEAFLAKHL